MPIWRTLGLQNGASFIITEYILFYDYITLFLILILTFVGVLILGILLNSFLNRFLIEGQTIETIWTTAPGLILIGVALPSLSILYEADETLTTPINLKITGNQWFWSYEYPDFKDIDFDSYPLPQDELPLGGLRLLEVDNRTPLPLNIQIKVIVGASDVIHAWTIPALGAKVDAIPGRLNQIILNVQAPGVYYGQCSEICGVGHRFMPIALESLSSKAFVEWLKSWK